MRRDRVGVYGGTAKTPTFDRFARSNIYFDQAFGQAPWTKPSVATLFTSLYPSQHGLASHPELRQRAGRDNSGELLGEVDVLGEGYTTLAEVLRGAGYNTAAFVSNPWMARPFGFDQGFDLYDDSFTGWDAPGQTISRKGLEWIENQRSGEKFFLYLHYWRGVDSHRPYGKLNDTDVTELLQAPPTETDRLPSSEHRLYEWLIRHEQQDLSMTMVDQLVAADPTIRLIELAYDRGVEAFDQALAWFLAGFSGRRSYEHTAILIISDHGEALYTRGYGSHGTGLYDDEAAVPVAVRLPGVSSRAAAVKFPIGLIDIMPTLCVYLDVECPGPVFGRSFIDDGQQTGRGAAYVVTEGVMFKPRNRTIRDRTHKLFWEPNGPTLRGAGEYSLYNVAADPGETRDLLAPDKSPEEDRVAHTLIDRLRVAVPTFDRPGARFSPLDKTLEKRLRSLGYLQ